MLPLLATVILIASQFHGKSMMVQSTVTIAPTIAPTSSPTYAPSAAPAAPYPNPAFVNMGTTAYFSAIAYSTVTNSGSAVLNGDLCVYPGTAVVGFPPGIINGKQYLADPTGLAAQSDLTIAYNDAAGRASDATISGDIGGRTFYPGVYKSTGTLALTGEVFFDGNNDPAAAWIFQIASTFSVANAAKMTFINLAVTQTANTSIPLWFKVGSNVVIGTTANINGVIMAHASVAVNTGAKTGALFSSTEGVTLLDNNVQAYTYPNSFLSTVTFSPAYTPTPSRAPSTIPSLAPSAAPSQVPSLAPSVTPSQVPSAAPSVVPSAAPSQVPTLAPSVTPSVAPSPVPSVVPSLTPSAAPSVAPTATPTGAPVTAAPSVAPTQAPTLSPGYTGAPSVAPTQAPTLAPGTTQAPSVAPSAAPSVVPSVAPSVAPSAVPSVVPSVAPSVVPSAAPSVAPSQAPSAVPTVGPSAAPSIAPSAGPTTAPSGAPVVSSVAPSVAPTAGPTGSPVATTGSPSMAPSVTPSQVPSIAPSAAPVTGTPSVGPTTAPSNSPATTGTPSVAPSQTPSVAPGTTHAPSVAPSVAPSAVPSQIPSVAPSAAPVTTTTAPTGAPVTQAPTASGTAQTEPSITFSNTVAIDGYTGTLPLSAVDKTAVTNSVAISMGVPESAVTYVSATTVSTRRRLANGKTVLSSSISVATSTAANVIDYPGQTADEVFAALSASLNAAASSGALSTTLANQVAIEGAEDLLGATAPSATSSDLVVTDPVTGAPSIAPTQAPSRAPTGAPTTPVFAAPKPLILGSTTTFAVIAGSTITNSGATTLLGNLALYPGTSVTGEPTVTGTQYKDDTTAQTAQSDLTIAYLDAKSRAADATLAGDLGGRTLGAGVYKSTSTLAITNTLYLDAKNNATACWIFQIASSFSLSTGASVVVLNAPANSDVSKNIFWAVGSSVVINSGVVLKGTTLASQSISVAINSVTGPLFASVGGVTLLTNTVTAYAVLVAGSTYRPTMAPTVQAAPIVSFTSTVGIVGYTGAVGGNGTVTLSLLNQATIVQTTAQTMGVPITSLEFVSASMTARRLLRAQRMLVGSTLSVVVKTTLNLIDYPAYSSADALYTALSNDLSTAAGNGQFTTALQTNAGNNGATDGLTSASVPTATSTEPTIETPPATSSGSDDDELSGGAIAGIVIACVVGALLIAAALWFFMCSGGSGGKEEPHMHSVVSQNEKEMVTTN